MAKPKKPDLNVLGPAESKRSPGSFYVKKNPNGKWSLMHESYVNGERKQETVSRALYFKVGLTTEMTVEKARAEIKKYNRLRKSENAGFIKQANALKRSDREQRCREDLLPPDFRQGFKQVIEDSHGTDRYKTRLIGVFHLVMELCSDLALLPSEYNDNINKITQVFKRKKYSLSYSLDIIYMLNWWGKYYSKQQASYFERIGDLKPNVKHAINEAHKSKETRVRTPALPLNAETLKRMHSSLDATSKDDELKYNWCLAAYHFGLRPSEADAFQKNPQVEEIDGVRVLVVEQTKTVFDDTSRDKFKRIPVLCADQEKSLDNLLNGKCKRPHPKWVDKKAKDSKKKYSRMEKYDCYSPRKGVTDYLLKELNQEIEDISIMLGHRSIETTWKFYKDKRTVQFTPTNHTRKKKLKVV